MPLCSPATPGAGVGMLLPGTAVPRGVSCWVLAKNALIQRGSEGPYATRREPLGADTG